MKRGVAHLIVWMFPIPLLLTVVLTTWLVLLALGDQNYAGVGVSLLGYLPASALLSGWLNAVRVLTDGGPAPDEPLTRPNEDERGRRMETENYARSSLVTMPFMLLATLLLGGHFLIRGLQEERPEMLWLTAGGLLLIGLNLAFGVRQSVLALRFDARERARQEWARQDRDQVDQARRRQGADWQPPPDWPPPPPHLYPDQGPQRRPRR